jgi:hypothetical protein
MRKKYLVSSVFIALLMLVSTQLVVMQNVKALSPHTGDAYVGTFWVSEMDVSAYVRGIENIGIAHAEAKDDWVYWTGGSGDIKANWSITLDNHHPKLFIAFDLTVYDTTLNNVVVGYKYCYVSVNANTSLNSNGQLTVQFNTAGQVFNNKTLACYLSAGVHINNTNSLKNFTSMAYDLSVLGLDHASIGRSFKYYQDYQNTKLSRPYSWVDGWEKRYSDADDMLNNQTFFKVGQDQFYTQGSSTNPAWVWGELIYTFDVVHSTIKFNVANRTIQWAPDTDGKLCGMAYCMYWYNGSTPWFWPVEMRWRFYYENYETASIFPAQKLWIPLGYTHARFGHYIRTRDMDNPPDHEVKITDGPLGHKWQPAYLIACTMGSVLNVSLASLDLTIYDSAIGNAQSTPGSGVASHWEAKCSYQNESRSVSVSNSTQGGVTTVYADIHSFLENAGAGETISTFKADRGETRVVYTC